MSTERDIQQARYKKAEEFVGFKRAVSLALGVNADTRKWDSLPAGNTVQISTQDAGTVLNVWNQQAKEWVEIESEEAYRLTMREFLRYFTVPKKDQRAMSLGSGPGVYETFLAQLISRIPVGKIDWTHLDFSGEMLRFNRDVIDYVRRQNNADLELFNQLSSNSVIAINAKTMSKTDINAAYVIGEMSLLPFRDKTFDKIICINSLQWMPDWKKVIAEMERISKKRGEVYLVHNAASSGFKTEGGEEMMMPAIATDELLDTLEKHNFEIYVCSEIKSEGLGQRGEDLWRFFIKADYRRDQKFTSWRQKTGRN